MRLDVLSKLGNVAARFCFFSKTSQRWQKGIFKRNKKTTSQNLWSQLSVTKKKKEDFLHVNEKKLEAPKKLLKPVDRKVFVDKMRSKLEADLLLNTSELNKVVFRRSTFLEFSQKNNVKVKYNQNWGNLQAFKRNFKRVNRLHSFLISKSVKMDSLKQWFNKTSYILANMTQEAQTSYQNLKLPIEIWHFLLMFFGIISASELHSNSIVKHFLTLAWNMKVFSIYLACTHVRRFCVKKETSTGCTSLFDLRFGSLIFGTKKVQNVSD